MSAADGKAAMSAHAARIAEHYDHARAKHPNFVDKMFIKEEDQSFTDDADSRLSIWRMLVSLEKPEAESVLMCEFTEARQAYALGNKAAAVEELYDTVAVLLRMVDVLEGRQALGAPEKAGGGAEVEL